MVSLSLESNRLSGKGNEPFTICVEPILEQMNALQIPYEHFPTVRFSLSTVKARKAASNVSLSKITVKFLISAIRNMNLFDKDVQDRLASRWMNVTYSQFGSKKNNEVPVTSKFIEHLVDHQIEL